jgi:putative membrane protein
MALACTSCIIITSCNNSSTPATGSTDSTAQTTTTNTDTTKPAGANAQQMATDASTSMKEAMARNPDSSFAVSATLANNEEIKVLQAGIDKGTSKELKAHAKMMLKDHEGLAKKMGSWAAAKNYTLPMDDNGNSDKDLSDMSGKTGNDWDKAWVDFMYGAHQKAIGLFEGAKNQVKDADLRALITATLPTLHQHLDMIKALQDKMK